MAFGLKEWKAKVAAGLVGWKERMSSLGVKSLYAFFAGVTVAPVIEALKTGDASSLALVGATMGASVGANLLSGQIEAWKDAHDVNHAIEQAVETNPDLRAELDTVLEKLETIPTAIAALHEVEREEVVAGLKAELERYKSWGRFQAQVSGSGAIAQGANNMAGGAGSVVAQEIHGPVTIINNPLPSAPGTDTLRHNYLNWLFEHMGRLSLEGVDPKAACEAKTRIRLSGIYTALLTRTLEEEEEDETRLRQFKTPRPEGRRMSALAQLNRHQRLVLLGDPGSGKSTFVNFVAMCLTGEGLNKADVNLALLTKSLPDKEGKAEKERQPWDHGPLLPVRVILRDLAATGLPAAGGNAGHLWQFIEKELQDASLGEYAPRMREELLQQGGLVLLDGLDEVPEADQRRKQLLRVVEEFAGIFFRCRILVTSRTYAYQKQDWRLYDFEVTELAPFTDGQVRCFVDQWYAHTAAARGQKKADAQGRAALLKAAIFGSDRLRDLAGRPLLLTLMASLHAWRGGSLPEKREELYAEAVELLLYTWERQRVIRDGQGHEVHIQPSFVDWLKVDREKMRGLLNRLAYEAHVAQPDLTGTADISQKDLVAGLMELSQNPEVNPRLLVEHLTHRAGLLLPRGIGVYTFPHRTFQEYLAACFLTDDDFPDQVAELARYDPDRWREVVLLAGAKAARGAATTIWSLAEALCFRKTGDPEHGLADDWGAVLAGHALVESADLVRVSERNRPKLDLVRQELVQVLMGRVLPARERAAAGNTLARLGDPRFQEDFCSLPREPLLGFVEIPSGPFWMGSDKAKDGQADDNETPQHRPDLGLYFISRYPVTVAQFRAFAAASNYAPRYRDCLQGIPNQPMVKVTWHDAMAYCDWLTEQLRESLNTPEPLATLLRKGRGDGPSWRITLPTEAQWEKAARGVRDALIFPWGDTPDPSRANYSDTGIETTSPVGCFPAGASPFGCLDMAGNVWEWTRILWGKDWSNPEYRYPYDSTDGRENLAAGDTAFCVLRGGAFIGDGRRVRCAARYRNYPNVGFLFVGFRVVASPTSL